MKATPSKQSNRTQTRVIFDLAEVLTAEELAKFQEAAREAKAVSLTEHFLNLTLRHPQTKPAA